MLTRKQHELLIFIDKRLQETGVSPSFDEMKDALELKSKSGIHRLITALEERGFIRRLPHRARALEILKLPDDKSLETRPTAVPDDATRPVGENGLGMDRPARTGFAPNVIPGNFPNAMPNEQRENTNSPSAGNIADGFELAEAIPLPLYGKIAAGTPIEALRDHSNHIDVPATMISSGEHYALEISGDSMVDAGIHDGDTVVIKRCDTAENGSIVVALIDDQEATLKRLRRRGASIALEPANQAYETRIFGPDRVKIQGQLIGLIRKY